ncbi:reprolysin-like metallopeptidase [Ignavibacterium sp.]|uniref:reprolysin-like metallopeptidase n=1 Tax=Ignavibacterium sp. TaxID=2651167 RepID=UPI00307FB873
MKNILLIVLLAQSINLSQSLWINLSESNISSNGERVIQPASYKIFELNNVLVKELLNSAPSEFTDEAKNNPAIITLPMPDGNFQKFKFWESPTMEPELQEKFPEIRTYTGQGIDDPYATLKMDFTPHGFHAMILSPNGRVFIDPYAKGEIRYYISYYSKDYVKQNAVFECELLYHDEYVKPTYNFYESILTPTGPQLRTYRLANAATGEYTQYHGGTVALGLAAVTTSVNRVNGVYEREVAIRMILVANNNLIIYTNPSTDPYTNSNVSLMLSQNISNLNTVIGSSNYDIGHVFSTGGGGVAYLGCVCTSNKAGGVTGSSNPIGDPFDIDYVAHEMGHQFGANHTFNGNTGSCSGNRNASTAYEPGSGSTIMAYAGICAPQNLQSNSDAYFHTISFDEIVAYTNFGSGNSCAQITNTGNNAPSITVPSGGFYIPKSTPFVLKGSATDPNSDALTYCWEEFDLGPAGDPNSPVGDAPIIRSFNPSSSNLRYIPQLNDLINNTSAYGVLLPTYSRNLKFRLTVRDNKAGGGGVDWRQVNFAVDGNSGPFIVTSPNAAVNWEGNSQQSVTWNVANTNLSPVNCANVRILLSTDGGYNFNDTILSSTANDGSELITVPNIATTQARIKVEAVGNIFFDISNSNFNIIYSAPAAFQFSQPIEGGWNLVSVPGSHPTNQGINSWWHYRDLSAGVFKFNNGYVLVDSVFPGNGYWMKHSGTRIYNTGDEWPSSGILFVPHDPLNVSSGWNLIGGYEFNAPVTSIFTNPPGIISGFIYGYTNIGGYQMTNTLLPGYGYWLKTIGAGQIYLNQTEGNFKLPEFNTNNFIEISIDDNSGKHTSLFLSEGEIDLTYFELPPVPLSEMFDARFASGRFVENISTEQTILIQGVEYPVTIRFDDDRFGLFDENKNQLKKSDDKVYSISDPEIKKLHLVRNTSPREFVLEQNYPNPFNPSTKICFVIPDEVRNLKDFSSQVPRNDNAFVTLKVYDILGNEVATLVNEEKPAGEYEVEFNGSSLSSGIYFYKLSAGSFTSVRKMILLR